MYGVDPLVPQATSTVAPINNEQIIKKVFNKKRRIRLWKQDTL